MTAQEWTRIILIGLCILCGLIMMACMLMIKRAKRLATVYHTYPGRGAPCTFVLISDLHVAIMPIPWGNIVKTIRDARPEFVILTGDLCNRIQETGRVACFVDLLAAKLQIPIYITLGNHDNQIFQADPPTRTAYIRELEALSPYVHVLEQDFVLHDHVLIGGLNDVHYNKEPVADLVTDWGQMAASRNLSFVLATHNADMLLKLENIPENFRPHLTVCGHTHGGQIRFPFNFEFTAIRKDKLPKKGYWYGVCSYKGFPLYITSGLGCSVLPIRSGSCAEVAVLQVGPEHG